MKFRASSLFAAAVVFSACGGDRLVGSSPKLDLSIEQAKTDEAGEVDFGDVVSPATAVRRVTVANSGVSLLHIMNVKQSGDSAFTISTPPTDVASGKSAAFTATFAPTAIQSYNGAVDFDTDDPNQAHVTIKLIGSGSNPNLVVCTGPIDNYSGSNCTDDGRKIDYGNGIENFTKTRVVRMLSATSSEVVVHSVQLVGDTAGAFKVDTLAADTTVPGNGNLDFNVVFAPPAQTSPTQTYTAQIDIESNDPNHAKTIVTLTGIGNTACSAFSETKTQAQAPVNKVDVLFVIDTSGSMGKTQKSITSQIATFITQLTTSQLDFNLAVTTTDMTNVQSPDNGTAQGKHGTLLPGASTGITIVHSAAPPAGGVVAGFQDILNNLDPDESGTEYGMLAARTATTPTTQTVTERANCGGNGNDCPVSPLKGELDSDFYRADARLAVVIVSDEDDGGTDQFADTTTAQAYASYFQGLKADPDTMLRVVAIADPYTKGIPDCDTGFDGGGDDGAPRYRALISALGVKQGLFIPYCTDIAQALQISGGFVGQPECTFDLTEGVMTVGPGNTITIEPSTTLASTDWHYLPPSAGHPYGQVSIDKNCPVEQSQLEIDYSSCLYSYDADADTVPDMQDNCVCATTPHKTTPTVTALVTLARSREMSVPASLSDSSSTCRHSHSLPR